MSCEEVREDLPAYVRGEIEGEREQEIDRHLSECSACEAEWAAMRQVLDSIAASDEGAVVRKWKEIVQASIDARASDIHLLPQKDGDVVRFRIDGVLHEAERVSKPLGKALATRFKVAAEMDVAEARVPQDGRIHIKRAGREFDLRVSCIPTALGEKITARILDRTGGLRDLDQLGLSDAQLAVVREFLALPAGMFIVTGPTGTGKTTLLYAMLRALNAGELNITTVEDPVEYILPGIAQTHVNPPAGLGFAGALKHQLRSDPDVMLCGEVRDLETAEVLIQATICGHLTMTTLHAQTAGDVPRRLLNMGVEPFLIADTLSLVCSLRLVRVICEACREEYQPRDLEKAWLLSRGAASTDLKAWRGKGCEECRHTGYWGRTAIAEAWQLTDPVRDLILKQTDTDRIREALAAAGHVSLVDDGMSKIRVGTTTVEEVRRATKGL